MVKRTTRPTAPTSSAQPEPAPGAAMTEPTPAPAPSEPVAADTGIGSLEAAQAVATSLEAAQAVAAGVAPGVWPDASAPAPGPHCPWCSAALASADLAICPSCGAQLNGAAEADVPGVTSIDVKALAWKQGGPPRRSRILSWISGDGEELPDASGAPQAAVEPPSLAVRREMLRLELEAEGITLPHDAEPPAAEEAEAEAGSGDPPATPGA